MAMAQAAGLATPTAANMGDAGDDDFAELFEDDLKTSGSLITELPAEAREGFLSAASRLRQKRGHESSDGGPPAKKFRLCNVCGE